MVKADQQVEFDPIDQSGLGIRRRFHVFTPRTKGSQGPQAGG
jgi:hypothetical protein